MGDLVEKVYVPPKLRGPRPTCKYCSNSVKELAYQGHGRNWAKTCGQSTCVSKIWRDRIHNYVCTLCKNAYIAKAPNQKYCKNCIPDRRHKWLVTRYGLNKDAFQVLLVKNNGQCKLCLKRQAKVVDHCHRTKKVRGLVCYSCNNLLAAAYDSIDTLKRAILYLEDKL